MDLTAATPAAPGPIALRYRVGGMDCPSCAGKIETALRRLPGAEGIRVNYQNQILALRLDETATPRAAVEIKVSALGYKLCAIPAPGPAIPDAAPPEDTAEATDAPWWRSRAARPLLAIGALLGLGALTGWLWPAAQGWTEMPAALLGLANAAPRAFALARAGSPFSIEMLMSVATFGALLLGAPAEAATVVFLFSAGEMMEGVAAGRARAGIRGLAALAPRTALLLEGETARLVPAATLRPGQVVLVRPGDRVPVDGVIQEGASALDESPVTGESMPVPRQEGEAVLAGSINGGGALRVRATHAASDTAIARIARLVEEAETNRAPTARFIERFSALYTPAVVAAATLTALLPPLLFGAAWGNWVYRGLALLLIGCPCVLVLSTPAAITAGIAAGARRGLLIKGGAALEQIGRVHTIAFDKTGTLTSGEPVITDVIALDGTVRAVLGLAAAVENGSAHPIARAILARAEAEDIPRRPARAATAIPGHAAAATVSGKRIVVGSPRYAAGQATLPPEILARIETLEAAGKTVVMVLADGAAFGLLALRDEPRPDAADGLAGLRQLGIRPLMLTGDNRRAAGAIAGALGIEARSELLPDDKLREIAALKARAPVAMVGDGINDTPALAAASVGIAMGGGTDVALETADAALLGGRVSDVAALVRLSRATLGNIRQNVAVALGLKAVFLGTTLAGLTGLWPAVLADTGATVLVTLNALRLLRYRG
ncbi:MAG TPA: heavy metal translocating P-type ATPase [Acetobacteraceae bacterium]|nr:heavy metal translocating P-type ATPase [Acetobacteraceae bacterium]